MSKYKHESLNCLDGLEQKNGPKLHQRIYDDILIKGLEFTHEDIDKFRPNIGFLRDLIEISTKYANEVGRFGDMFGEWLEYNNEINVRAGQYFTPIDVVDMMVEAVFGGQDLGRQKPWVICDPASGTGRFMLRIADYFANNNGGTLNFVITNVDSDGRAFVYCTANAILNGIPAFHIYGDSLKLEVWDAFVTVPVGRYAYWYRIKPGVAHDILIQFTTPFPDIKMVNRGTDGDDNGE